LLVSTAQNEILTRTIFTRNAIEEGVTKIEIIGAEDHTEGSVTLRPNRFRPEAGVRARLRTALHETLDEGEVTTPAKNSDSQSGARYTDCTCRLEHLWYLFKGFA